MNKKQEKNIDKKIEYETEIGEDATKYGEFISTYFAWIPPEKQKQRAEELDKNTKKREK